jgi:glycosyltransferase involved in cell wall biosynthesis
MNVSLIMPTHNPRPDFLGRVLESIRRQTLPQTQWEFLMIDNHSKEPLAGAWDLSWHPRARHVREDTLGRTPAMLRGFAEAKADLFVTVDDDNVLQPDYLERAVGIGEKFPWLGAWGGRVIGEFELEAPPWIQPYLHILAIREVDRDYWSNYHADNRSLPFGAGLCARRCVAEAYAKNLTSRPASQKLGRTGTSLLSGEDVDLAMTAYDIGYGTGLFRRLHITHLIPKTRMTVDYIARLIEGIEYSNHVLRNQRNPSYLPPQKTPLKAWLRNVQVWRLPEPVRSFARAEHRGQSKALTDILAGASPQI